LVPGIQPCCAAGIRPRAEYQRRQALCTPEQIAEQRAEARAAHGPGVELVNIFTGCHYRT
jgi:hypothetical protein